MKPLSIVVSLVLTLLIGVTVSDIYKLAREPVTAPTVEPERAPARAAAAVPASDAPLDRTPQADSDRIPIGASPALGPAFAPVTIVEFSDFQCPFCGGVEATMRDLRARFGDRVRVVWKHNPLPIHNNAMAAAEAAQEALAQGGAEKFWRMHDLLFEHQDSLDRPGLERFAQELGLDMTRFRAALDNHTHQAAIQADMALLTRLGGRGTPNFYINGSNLRGQQPLATFARNVEAALDTARSAAPGRAYAEGVTAALARPSGDTTPGAEDANTVYRVPVGNSPVRGPATALVTVVVFSDFQCPFCGRVEPTLDQLRQRYGDDIRFVWKNEPLAFHPRARPAAEVAMEAFAERGAAGFWRAHDLLFQHNTALERADLEGYARTLGLDAARVRTALDQNTHDAAINADHDLAQQLGVDGTPAFFINGRKLVGAKPLEAFVAAVDEARRLAEETMRQPGVTRANVYERMMANARPGPRAPGGSADPDRLYNVRAATRAPSWGPADARVTINLFSDFQCPFCNRVRPAVEEVKRRYGTRVRLVWRNFPLRIHDNAMIAAEAATEVFAQRGDAAFWAFHDVLFSHQDALDRAHLEQYAQEAHLDMPRFRAALDNHTHRASIDDDMAAAQSTGAALAMPSFFINGRFVVGAVPVEEITRRIDAALAAR